MSGRLRTDYRLKTTDLRRKTEHSIRLRPDKNHRDYDGQALNIERCAVAELPDESGVAFSVGRIRRRESELPTENIELRTLNECRLLRCARNDILSNRGFHRFLRHCSGQVTRINFAGFDKKVEVRAEAEIRI